MSKAWCIDSPAGVAQAAEHLISLGHRDIVYVSGPENSWSNEARWRVAGRGGGPAWAAGTPARSRSRRSALRIGRRRRADQHRATACIVFNDLLAIGMLTRLRERGVGVPGEISVVGCDDIFGADFCHPTLTTLAAPIEQAGRVAVSMLLARLHDSAPATRQSAVLPTHLIVRESTGPAPR